MKKEIIPTLGGGEVVRLIPETDADREELCKGENERVGSFADDEAEADDLLDFD